MPYYEQVLSGTQIVGSINNINSNLKLSVPQLSRQIAINEEVVAFQPAVASGGTGPYSYSISPELPNGLFLNTTTGFIRGTPVTSEIINAYTITVIDSNNNFAAAPILLILKLSSDIFNTDNSTHSTWNLLPDSAKEEINFANANNYIKKGAIIKFKPAIGYHFDANNNMLPGVPYLVTDKMEIFAGVTDVSGRIFSPQASGIGSVTLNVLVPNGAIVEKIYPVFKTSFSNLFVLDLVNLIKGYKNFAISYNSKYQTWRIISDQNLNSADEFSLTNELDFSNSGKDSSWLIKFEFNGSNYNVHYRNVEYVFQSANQVNFYKDETVRIYDPKSGQSLNDQITIFKTNTSPDSVNSLGADYVWYIYKSPVDTDGYTSNSKVLVTYSDKNNDGIPDNPEIFTRLINPKVNPNTKRIYFKNIKTDDRFFQSDIVKDGVIDSSFQTVEKINQNLNLYFKGQIFYATDAKKFYQIDDNGRLVEVTGYTTCFGRQGLYFQYRHNSSESRRIDPGTTNIIDIYVLTSSYENAYRKWISDSSGSVVRPLPPSTVDLSNDFASLNDIRSLSDTVIFHSAIFKPIFGVKADSNLQAVFKVVKNPSIETSDNDIKTSVIDAVNNYFDINNWDFGETFYFSELSAYLHRVLVPNIASVTIVPTNIDLSFGHLYQINSEPNEIIVSAATVENVEIITSLTAAQLNLAIK
jgi:hypothetical protein